MNKDQKLNFNFEVQEPKQKNNIVVFFLKSKENANYDLLSFPYAIKNNLVEIEEVSQKGFIGADLTVIPKKEVEYEYKSHSNITVSHLDEKINLGVTVIGIFAGLNF